MACDKLILTLKNKIHLYTYKENFSKKKEDIWRTEDTLRNLAKNNNKKK